MFNPVRMKAMFKNEAELCRAFISQLPSGWVAFPETAGFDILLVRSADDVQIGIEAKMSLNAKVVLQAVSGIYSNWGGGEPDYRAALVPCGTAGGEMRALANRLGVTVIEMKDKDQYLEMKARDRCNTTKFSPPLPGEAYWSDDRVWTDLLPEKRCAVPAYVPDVAAGRPSPSTLSEWKIKAIKICIIMEKRGFVTSADFSGLHIAKARFVQMGWIKMSEIRGRYVAGPFPLNLRKSHPVNYPQIEADYEIWMKQAKLPLDVDAPKQQGSML